MANGGNCVRLAGPALAEQQQVAAVLDPVVTGGEGQEVRFADAGGGVEIDGGEGLACGQAGLVAMALDAPGGWISHRSEEHTSEPQSVMRTSSAVFCLKNKER